MERDAFAGNAAGRVLGSTHLPKRTAPPPGPNPPPAPGRGRQPLWGVLDFELPPPRCDPGPRRPLSPQPGSEMAARGQRGTANRHGQPPPAGTRPGERGPAVRGARSSPRRAETLVTV